MCCKTLVQDDPEDKELLFMEIRAMHKKQLKCLMDMNGWVDDWKSERIDMSIQVDRPLPFHHLEAIIIDPVVVVTMEGVMKHTYIQYLIVTFMRLHQHLHHLTSNLNDHLTTKLWFHNPCHLYQIIM